MIEPESVLLAFVVGAAIGAYVHKKIAEGEATVAWWRAALHSNHRRWHEGIRAMTRLYHPFTMEALMLETIMGEIKEMQATQKAMAEKQAALSAQMDELVNAVKSVTTADLSPVMAKLDELKSTLGTAQEETEGQAETETDQPAESQAA